VTGAPASGLARAMSTPAMSSSGMSGSGMIRPAPGAPVGRSPRLSGTLLVAASAGSGLLSRAGKSAPLAAQALDRTTKVRTPIAPLGIRAKGESGVHPGSSAASALVERWSQQLPVAWQAPVRSQAPWLLGICLAATLSGLLALVSAMGGGLHGLLPGVAGQSAVQSGGATSEELNLSQGALATATPTRPVPTKTPVQRTTTGFNTSGQPCQSTDFWVSDISMWATPPDCYATIYTPNPKNYPGVPSAFGYCNWWVEALHTKNRDILDSGKYPRGHTPVPGAAIFFSPNVQGASSAGHYAQVVAVAPDGYWMLITEMNFAWRGGGFGRVDYRYAHVGPGVTFIYTS
jgi:hypothetical protein